LHLLAALCILQLWCQGWLASSLCGMHSQLPWLAGWLFTLLQDTTKAWTDFIRTCPVLNVKRVSMAAPGC
jgi:hypothetical protein